VLGVANAGADTVSSIKQARESRLTQQMRIAATLMFIQDVHALGLEAGQGLSLTESFCWDLNDRTRAFASLGKNKIPNYPNMTNAGATPVEAATGKRFALWRRREMAAAKSRECPALAEHGIEVQHAAKDLARFDAATHGYIACIGADGLGRVPTSPHECQPARLPDCAHVVPHCLLGTERVHHRHR